MLDDLQRRVLEALLAMQRQSWEQGVLSHALLDLELWQLAEVVARDAVALQRDDGRLGEVAAEPLVNSASLGEVVAWASIRDPALRAAVGSQIGYLLTEAPRAPDGTLYHLSGARELWVDTVYMVVPLLVLANEEEAALAQFRGHRDRLFDDRANLWGWRFDVGSGTGIHPLHWGTGNGWVVAAIARSIHLGLRSTELADHAHAVVLALLELRAADGSFHNIVDDPETFEENTVGLMLAYALFTGMADGWLPSSYAPVAHALVEHARTLVDEHGLVQRVCGAPHFDRQGTSAEAQAFFLLATAAETRFAPLG